MAAAARNGGMRCYSLQEVAKHNSKDDLWVVVEGKVLDLTKFAASHPGGEESILKVAGKDASMLFKTMHKPGTLESQESEVHIGYTPEEVAKHNTKDDLWVVLDSKVLDMTKFVHPGGQDPILRAAGKDATLAFNAVSHPPGTLEQYEAQLVIGHPKAKDSKKAGGGLGFLGGICSCICGSG